MIRSAFTKEKAAILVLCIILFTFLRSFFIPLYFLLPLLFYSIIPYKINNKVALLLLFSVLNTVFVSFFSTSDLWANYFLSSYVILIIIFLFLVSPSEQASKSIKGKIIFFFVKCASYCMIVNNIIGGIAFLVFPFFPITLMRDDSFIGIYGKHGIGPHGLAILNALFFLFYFSKFRYDGKRNSLLLSFFFLLSFILAFYGMGLMMLAVSFLVYYIILKRSMILTFGICIIMLIMFSLVYFFAPKTFLYNYKNIEKFSIALNDIEKRGLNPEHDTPRKLYLYYYYYKEYVSKPRTLFLGTGPGTFNSRIAFLLNGNYSPGNPFEKVLGVHNPSVAVKYIFPLWDRKQVGKLKTFTDGTRNQPFSSIIALLAEYGLIFFILLSMMMYKKVKNVFSRLRYGDPIIKEKSKFLREFLALASIFIFFNLLADNLLEFTEIIVFLIFFKLIEAYSLHIGPDKDNDNLTATD